MDNKEIQLLQYANLRYAFRKLHHYALGKDYYTVAMDVYTSDVEICLDIMHLIWRKRHPIKALFYMTPDYLKETDDGCNK